MKDEAYFLQIKREKPEKQAMALRSITSVRGTCATKTQQTASRHKEPVTVVHFCSGSLSRLFLPGPGATPSGRVRTSHGTEAAPRRS